MEIDSPRFGKLQVEESRIIEFPNGLAGFEDCKRFTLFHPELAEGAPPYFILQSVDDAAVAFHIADPAQYGFNFDVELSDEELALLDLREPADAAVVVILSKGGDGSGPLRANLNAPIVLNLAARRGLQHMFRRLNYAVSQGD